MNYPYIVDKKSLSTPSATQSHTFLNPDRSAVSVSHIVFIILKKIILISLFIISVFHPAHARVIGLVVDDSGSMLNRFETPLFAAQVLISVLKEDDRLFVTRLSERGKIHSVDLRNREDHIAAMRKEWIVINLTPTPYPSVDAMLSHIAQKTRPGEQACLLVITDGDFNEGLPPPRELRRRYEQIRDSFKGESLQVFFVVFTPRGARGDQYLEAIEAQKVRENLLLVFNGDQNIGNVVVRDGGELYGALMDIISLMVGVDPRHSEGALSIRDKTLEISVPFTLNRLVIISAGSNDMPSARLEKESFPSRVKQSFQSTMRRTDKLTRRVLNSDVFHIVPWPPLSTGQTPELIFDRSIRPDDLRILFETAVKVEWEVFDENGTRLNIDPDGYLEVSQNQKITLNAYLVEPINGQDTRIDFGRLPHSPEFTIHHEADSLKSTDMTVDINSSSAYGSLSFALPGRYSVAVSARYPGFLNKRAKDLKVSVREEIPVAVSVKAYGGKACPNCTANRTTLFYTTSDPFREVLLIEINTESPKESRYKVKLDKHLPQGVKILLPDGHQLGSSGATLFCSQGKPTLLSLQYNRHFQQNTETVVNLNVFAKSPLKGEAMLSLHLVPAVADMQLESAGSTLSTDDKAPFQLKVTELDKNHGIFIRASGVDGPLEARHVAVEEKSLPLTVELQKKDNLIFIKPGKKWFCDCLTPSGIHDFTIRYHHPETRQQALYSGTLELLPVPFWQRCWLEILLAILALLLASKLWCLARTHRFPRNSCVHYFQEGEINSMRARRHQLHRWWHWILPFCGDARTRVGIFQLRASGNHLLLEYRPNYPEHFIYGTQSLNEYFESKQNKPLKINWETAISDAHTKDEYRLRRDCRKKLY